MTTITRDTYNILDKAFDFFNDRLWAGQLPPVALLLHRKRGARGYFAPERIGFKDDSSAAHEISLNPDTFLDRDLRDVLSTLVHEMAHLWQERYGEATRNGYHNREWASEMDRIGLTPSSTGEPGGKRTGQRVSHYIEEGGLFDVACAEFLRDNALELDWFAVTLTATKDGEAKKASKTKYTCPDCDANAWAKPGAKLICGTCEEMMLAEDDPDLELTKEARRNG